MSAASPLPKGPLTRDPRLALQGNVVDATTFYRAHLWHSFNIRNVLQETGKATRLLGPAGSRAVEDAIVRDFWEIHGGVLMPPRMLAMVSAASALRGGSRLVQWTDEWMESICRAGDGMPGAERAYGVARAEASRVMAASQALDPLVMGAAEFVADFLLLQRALAEDVRAAEANLAPTALRARVLAAVEQKKEGDFLRYLAIVLKPDQIVARFPAGAEAVARTVAPSRTASVSVDGLFAALVPHAPI